ncbi:MAG: leucyl aminopeptidase, partial [Flavobacteriaceae bacterium]
VATLTGAVLYALGRTHTALFGNESAEGLIKEFEKAGEQSKDLVWNMPLLEEHVEVMKGINGVSDLINSEGKPGPGSTTAAAFLNEFVDEDVPFAHLDIAATASDGDEVTGRPVKLLVQFLINK